VLVLVLLVIFCGLKSQSHSVNGRVDVDVDAHAHLIMSCIPLVIDHPSCMGTDIIVCVPKYFFQLDLPGIHESASGRNM